jgi:hypothetical protein
MCPFIILRVVEAIAFELCQIPLLDGTTMCQLENDYVVVEGESLTKLLFSLFRHTQCAWTCIHSSCVHLSYQLGRAI